MNNESAILAGALVVIALIACCAATGLLALLFQAQEAEVSEEPPPPPVGEGPGPVNESGVTEADLEVWSRITKENVESVCLEKAKEEAGSSDDLVYSCTCDEDEHPATKSYDCEIDTADPFTRYFAIIVCSLESELCFVETNYGTETLDFTQLASLG